MKKKHLVENCPSYQADHDVISAVDDHFEGQEETFLKTGIRMLNTVGRSAWTAKEIVQINNSSLP